MKSARACVLFFLCASLFQGCGSNYAKCPDPVDGTYEAPNGAGALVVQDGVRILKLHGNAGYDTGYAYGYLLAAEIVYIVDNLIMPVVHERGYESLRDSMALVDWDNAYGEDLEGMLAGIQARLGPRQQIIHPYPWRRGRTLDLVDLQLVNSMSDWLCSSFSVWGQGRADGSTLYARNLDYYAGRNDAFQRGHVIISFDDGAHARWAGASVCGLAGGITAMNEYGMTLALHNTDFFPSSDMSGFIPRTMMVRKLMEQAGPDWTPATLDTALDLIPDYFGTNLHATFPSAGRTDDQIAGVLEFDGDAGQPAGRATLRSPSENPGLPVYEAYDHSLDATWALINTNHYVERKPATGSVNNSGDRYLTIKEMLGDAQSDDNVTAEEARSIMAAVGGVGTMHTVIFEPDARLFRVYLAEPGKPAFDCPPHVYAFEDLF